MTDTEGPPTFVGADVRPAFAAPTAGAIAPGRLRRPLADVLGHAATDELLEGLATWLNTHRTDVVRVHDPAGRPQFGFAVPEFETLAPDLAASARRLILAKMPEALEAIGVPEFEPTGVEFAPTLYHHEGERGWGDGWTDTGGTPVPMRRVAFDLLTVAAQPRFKGGDIEFPNGDVVTALPRRLAFLHPLQAHRIRRVECFSADMLHGRWSLSGWVLGHPPAGWLDRVAALRGER